MPRKLSAALLMAVMSLSLPLSGAPGQIIPPEAGLPVIDWTEAKDFINQDVVVQGRIVATHRAQTICFLNFDEARTFTAVVYDDNWPKFSASPNRLYKDKLLRIRGTISTYQGKPQIEIADPKQVTVLEKELPIPQPPARVEHKFNGTVTVATYNTLNLFDEYDDPYHADEGTPAKPREELERLAATIKSLDADVLCLQEVENRGYLERFNRAFLGDLGYQHVVCIDSNDRRGIDCAVLSRLPVGPVTSYRHLRFDNGSGGRTGFRRDLLRVRIEPPGTAGLDVFVVHLKSKRSGAEATEAVRVAEATQIRAIFDEMLRDNPEANFLICGDFNDTWDSQALKVLRGSGEAGLHDFLKDAPTDAVTYNRTHLSMIDFILTSPALARVYVEKSYRIVSGTVESSGSDHNPIVARFLLSGEGHADSSAITKSPS